MLRNSQGHEAVMRVQSEKILDNRIKGKDGAGVIH